MAKGTPGGLRDKGRKAVEKKAQTLGRLSIEYVPIDSIHPNNYNPNRQSDHDFELLMRSMEEDGFTQPIVCQRESREIVDGEHRWRAATKLGFTEIPVVFTDMTPEQMRIATLRHNRARGSEDMELSAQVLRDLQNLGALDWAQDSLMLDDTEIERLLNDVQAPEVLASEEFSQAWVPTKSTTEEAAHAETGEGATNAREIQSNGGVAVSAMTSEAAGSIREREKKLQSAKTEEERQMIAKDDDTYRLFLMFSGEEAKVVKAVLGTQPAEVLVKLCQKVLSEKVDEGNEE